MSWSESHWTEPEPGAPVEPPRESPAARSGWHPVNVGHLVMGVAFVGLTLVWALLVSDTLALEDHRWLLPAPWIAAGAIGLAASASRGRRPGSGRS